MEVTTRDPCKIGIFELSLIISDFWSGELQIHK